MSLTKRQIEALNWLLDMTENLLESKYKESTDYLIVLDLAKEVSL